MRVMNERSRAMLVLKYAVLTLTALLMLFPVYALILSSFRPGRELMRYGVGLTTLVPTNLNLEMLKGLLTYRDGLYLVWYRNSLVISILQMAASRERSAIARRVSSLPRKLSALNWPQISAICSGLALVRS